MRAEPSVLFCSSAAVPPAEWIFPVLSLDYLARIRDNDSRVLLAESFEQEPPAAVSSRPVCNQLKEKTPEGAGGEMKPEQILQQFLPEGQTYTYRPFGNGHINDTFLVTTPERKLILQRINQFCDLNEDGENGRERFFGLAGAPVCSYTGRRERFLGVHRFHEPQAVLNGKELEL